MVIKGIIDLDNGELLEATGKHRISALDIQGSETATLNLTFYKNGKAVTDSSVLTGASIDFGVKADADYTGASYLVYHNTFSASSDGLTFTGTPTWATAEVETALGNESSVKLHSQVKVVINGITYYSQVFEVEIHNNVIQAAGSTSSVIFPRLITTTSDPTANDDSLDGYGVSSIWLNTSNNFVFVLMNNTAGAAVWKTFISSTLTAALNANNNKITNLTDGTASSDAATKGQLDALVNGAPDNLNTLDEIAAALNDDNSIAASLTNNIAGKLPLAGGTLTGHVLFNDGIQAKFGTHSDLTIQHDGNSYISENGTGDFYITTNDASIFLQDAGSGRVMLAAKGGSGEKIELNHSGSKKFETLSTGVKAYGLLEISAGALQLDSAYALQWGNNNNRIWGSSGNNYIVFETNATEAARFDSSGDFLIPDTNKIKLGDDGDLEIFYNTDSFIKSSAELKIASNVIRFLKNDLGEYTANFIGDAGVELFYNGSKTFETTTDGISVTGKIQCSDTIRSENGNFLGGRESAAAPTYRFHDDSDTGMFNIASNILAFSTGGTEAARFDSSGHFLIGNSATMSVANAQRLVVGDGAGAEGITIYSGSDNAGYLYFADGTSGDQSYRGQINYNQASDHFTFHTASAERMRLNSTGLGIGVTPSRNLTVASSTSNVVMQLANSTTGTTADNGLEVFVSDNDAGIVNRENGYLRFDTNNTEAARFDSSGHLLLNSTSSTGDVFQSTATDGIFAARLIGSQNSGQSNGLRIRAGFTSSDHAMLVENWSGTDLFKIKGDGSAYFNSQTTNTVATFESTDTGAGILLADDTGTSKLETSGAELRVSCDDNDAVNNSVIKFRLDGATKATLDSTGLGIGCTPSQMLEVAGDIFINGGAAGGRSLQLQRTGAANPWKLVQGHTATDYFEILEGSNTRFTIKNDGNVGIGTTTPSEKIDLSTGSYPTDKNYIRFGASNEAGRESGGLIWKTKYSGYTKTSASIEAVGDNNYFRNALIFKTENTADQSTDAIERMRIASDGDITQNYINYTDGSNYEALKISAESDHILFKTESIGSFASNTRPILFKTGANTRAQIDNTGLVSYANLYISGTGSLRNTSSHLNIATSTQTDNDIIFKPNDTEAVRIFASTLRIHSAEDKSWTVGDKVASLEFFSADQSGSGPNSVRSEINLVTENTFGSSHSLSFATREDVSGSPTEKAKITSSGDMELVTDGKGLILSSPDGTRYKITVANGGAVTSTAM